jgi:class 3 adenylate cyclase
MRVGARFCDACGAPVEEMVPATSMPPPRREGAPLPDHLAEKVRLAGSLEGERKQVTVLFADVAGSMDLAEHVDPEVWRGLVDRFFTLVCEAVHLFDGTVNKFTGDGAMVFFGAPVAHEDHARRACYAALQLRDVPAEYGRELRRDHGLGFSVRLGLNSGEVVVGTVGRTCRWITRRSGIRSAWRRGWRRWPSRESRT